MWQPWLREHSAMFVHSRSTRWILAVVLLLSNAAGLYAPAYADQPGDFGVLGAHAYEQVDPRTANWTMTELLKDWLITPFDIAISDGKLYVSGNLDNRVAVLSLDGQLLRYYVVEKNPEFDNVSVGVTSDGRVLALSGRGLWELMPDGQIRQIARHRLFVDHMAVGPDDAAYISYKSGPQSIIARIGPDGSMSRVLAVGSNRISDLDFDPEGNLYMFDAQHGQILTYAQAEGVRTVSTGFADPSGGGPAYLAFDPAGKLLTASARFGLALVDSDGTLTRLPVHVTGDLVFHEGFLYALEIYTSNLYQLEVDGDNLRGKRALLEGTVPWYISVQGDTLVGERLDISGNKMYFSYPLGDAHDVSSNQLLNSLRPRQYTADSLGNSYVLMGNNLLKKIDSAGREEFSVPVPGRFDWDTRLYFNPADGRIYYFDEASNSVFMADGTGTELYHTFASQAQMVRLVLTEQGRVYAAARSSDGATLLDISDPERERAIWSPGRGIFHFKIAADAPGNLYAALGPRFQQVLHIDPDTGQTSSIVPQDASRFDLGFVDPQGFAVTPSGSVIVSAPGVMVMLTPMPR